jgi:glycosyltransferase involved in cell wall biosynthesis
MAAILIAQHGLPAAKIAVLPPRINLVTDARFSARLRARLDIARASGGSRHWVWISRVEPWKGTGILAAIARLVPHDRFDVFGPVHGSMESLDLDRPNIVHCGVLTDVIEADLGKYTGFLFTSRFEGMPNIVLEVSQHVIPMVLADVGGLRDTFNDNSVMFVPHKQSVTETAIAFVVALNRVATMASEDLSAMVEAAHAQVSERHSPDGYASRVNQVFGPQ